MALNPVHFRDLVHRSLLRRDGGTGFLYSPDAEELVLGTVAKESDFGTHLRQLSGGPGLGIGQIEPSTFEWMVREWVARYPELAGRRHAEVEWDLDLSIFVVRLRYKVAPPELPSRFDPLAMGRYWEKWYNTLVGPRGGTPEDFVKAHRIYVLGRTS